MLASAKIYTMEQIAYATNVRLTLHSNQVYSNRGYRSSSANDPNAPLLNSINDAAIDGCEFRDRDFVV